jgi:hypothetical protein
MELEDNLSYRMKYPTHPLPRMPLAQLQGEVRTLENRFMRLTPLFPSISAQLSGIGPVYTLHSRHRREERRPHQLHIVLFTVETIPQPDAPGQVEVLGDAGKDVPVSWNLVRMKQ